MSDSLSVNNTPFLHGFVFIISKMEARDLATEISLRLLGSEDSHRWRMKDREEVPSLILEGVLGCDLELIGDPASGFNVTLTPHAYPHEELTPAAGSPVEIDVSGILLHLLRDIPGAQVRLT